MTTLLLTSPRYLDHDMGHGHPERPQRLVAIQERLAQADLPGLVYAEPAAANLESVTANHDPEHVELILRLSGASRPIALTPDTFVGPATYEAALLAAGGSLQAADAVMAGEARNAFCLHRPPGHHAERNQAMGFCFFNHVAIAARHLLARHGLQRVAIVDWDVHHGNGTQNSFYADGDVFYFSVHQEMHFPFTGMAHETGSGEGLGTTLNVPLSAGHGDDDYLRIFREQLRTALEAFQPEFLLVSTGFDAHADDPLGDMQLSTDGFAALTQEATKLADDLCGGRLVSLLEGGYDLGSTAAAAEAHVRVLLA